MKDEWDSMLHEVKTDKKKGKASKDLLKKLEQGRKLQTKLDRLKREFKETKYRRKYDGILDYIDRTLVNTETYRTAMKSLSTGVSYSFVYENGSYAQIPILARNNQNDERTRVPVTSEPIAFSKILTAVSVLASKVPDAEFKSYDKIYARTQYELWKDTWLNPLGNGKMMLQHLYQSMLLTGVGFYRVFPKRVQHMHRGVKRILFDGVYRMAMNPKRTWIGNSVNLYDSWSTGEVLYEMDEPVKNFLKKHPDAKDFQLEYASTNDETEIDDSVKNQFVVIKYYENPVQNKYCVACGNYPLYEGEMPNVDGWGHVMWANCFIREPNDPYGVGFVELMRGNIELYDYINQLSAQQVEAEISPLIFGTNTGLGEMNYRRGPNIINPKTQGSELQVVKTSGNVQQSLLYADKQKQIISENTGINDILAGTAGDSTLGSTVLMREASLNRLIIPRTNICSALEKDAYATVAWLRQLYSVDRMEFFSTETEVQQFVANNPNYFVNVETYQMLNGNDKFVVEYSKRVPLTFDIILDGDDDRAKDDIEEITSEYEVPAVALYQFLQDYNHISHRLIINVDGTSTILPSEEINKQQVSALYQVVSPKTVEIMQMMQMDPNLSRILLTQLESFVVSQGESIYKWFPKDIYDQIMTPQPQIPPEMMAMMQQGGTMQEGANAPQNMPNQIPMTQSPVAQELSSMSSNTSPMGSANNASIGRAALGQQGLTM